MVYMMIMVHMMVYMMIGTTSSLNCPPHSVRTLFGFKMASSKSPIFWFTVLTEVIIFGSKLKM